MRVTNLNRPRTRLAIAQTGTGFSVMRWLILPLPPLRDDSLPLKNKTAMCSRLHLSFYPVATVSLLSQAVSWSTSSAWSCSAVTLTPVTITVTGTLTVTDMLTITKTRTRKRRGWRRPSRERSISPRTARQVVRRWTLARRRTMETYVSRPEVLLFHFVVYVKAVLREVRRPTRKTTQVTASFAFYHKWLPRKCRILSRMVTASPHFFRECRILPRVWLPRVPHFPQVYRDYHNLFGQTPAHGFNRAVVSSSAAFWSGFEGRDLGFGSSRDLMDFRLPVFRICVQTFRDFPDGNFV